MDERRAEDSAPYLESAAKDGISAGPVPPPGPSDGSEPNAAGSGDPAYNNTVGSVRHAMKPHLQVRFRDGSPAL